MEFCLLLKISETNLSRRCSQKLLGHAEKSAADTIKTISHIQATEEATDYLIGIKTANEITENSNNPETSSQIEEKLTETPKDLYRKIYAKIQKDIYLQKKDSKSLMI